MMKASPFKAFPNEYASPNRYVTISSDGLHQFDWSTLASVPFNSVNEDIYLIEDEQLKLQTSYFQKYHGYQLKSIVDGAEVYEPLV